MRIQPFLAVAGAGLLLAACLTGGAPSPDRCEIDVVGLEQNRSRPDGLDVAYRVRGEAGSAATVWLVAQNPSGSYVPGYGVDVGPGRFEAIVDLALSGMPEKFFVVLEVAGKRCTAKAPRPGR